MTKTNSVLTVLTVLNDLFKTAVPVLNRVSPYRGTLLGHSSKRRNKPTCKVLQPGVLALVQPAKTDNVNDRFSGVKQTFKTQK